MDYSRFRFRSEIDWIGLDITTLKPSQPWGIQRRHPIISFVAPLDPGPGGAAMQFRCRLQAPRAWTEIDKVIAAISSDYDLASPPVVSEIEVALDAYGHCDSDLIEMTAHFYKYCCVPASDNRRFGGRFKGDTEGIENFPQLLRRLSQGRVINIGNADDPRSQRVYFKRRDNNHELPASKRRARFEVTLRGSHLPLIALGDWRSFPFERLAPEFKFRQLKEARHSPVVALVAKVAPQLGERAKRRRRQGGSRLYSGLTRADTALNRRAYDALRDLTRRMSAT